MQTIEAQYLEFDHVSQKIVNELIALPSPTGKPRPKLSINSRWKLGYSVAALMRDALSVIHKGAKGKARISLDRNAYGKGTNDPITYDIHVGRAYRGMIALGYLEQTNKGYHNRSGNKHDPNKSKRTRYQATAKLVGLFDDGDQNIFPVIIPPQSAELLRVNDTKTGKRYVPDKMPETRRMRGNLEKINSVLLSHWFDLAISDDESLALAERLKRSDKPPISMCNRSLYRVFNDPKLKTGGRFYGGWWQGIPNKDKDKNGKETVKYRPNLVVNGESMIELDYKEIHPVILYAMEGVECPDECYASVITYKKLPEGKTSKNFRDIIKMLFHAMLNAEPELKNPPGRIKLSDYGLRFSDVMEAIKTYHAPIAHHFGTGIGLKLQRTDSDIAEQVMMHFIDKGIPILPVHDSFLIAESHAAELRTVMEQAFNDAVPGASIRIDQEAGPEPALVSVTDGARPGHELRLQAFERQKRESLAA